MLAEDGVVDFDGGGGAAERSEVYVAERKRAREKEGRSRTPQRCLEARSSEENAEARVVSEGGRVKEVREGRDEVWREGRGKRGRGELVEVEGSEEGGGQG